MKAYLLAFLLGGALVMTGCVIDDDDSDVIDVPDTNALDVNVVPRTPEVDVDVVPDTPDRNITPDAPDTNIDVDVGSNYPERNGN
jgi:hypothetical protein